MTRQLQFTFRNVLSALIGTASLVAAPPVLADSSRVISVEEHWELQLAEPDAARSAPQTTMVMSPRGDLSGTHFLFTLNHVAAPDYQPGGMQVQLWEGEDLVNQAVGHESAALEHVNETVRWAQRIVA